MSESLPQLPTQAERLRFAREHAGFPSARAAALHFKWNENTYKSHESGVRATRGLPENILRHYAKAFRVPWNWLAIGVAATATATIPIISYVGAGAAVFPATEPFDEIEPPPNCPPGAFALIVRGDSQMPVFEDGDVLICVPVADPSEALWKRAIVDLEDGRRLLKQITPGTAQGKFALLSLNAAPMNDVRILRAARIVWHKPT